MYSATSSPGAATTRSSSTWGRDDYPVLKRNAAFFMTPMPFEPPLDAQLIFGLCCLGSAHQR